MKKYDVFISYRRNGAEDFARAIYQDLKHKGFKVFLDRQNLMSGDYEEQVLNVIRNCRDVIIILPPNALDRCSDDTDLFGNEISCAIENNRNIISIVREGFKFPPEDQLPEKIRSFPKYEAIMENPNAYESVMKRLCDMLKDSKRKQNKIKTARLKKILVSLFAAMIVISGGVLVYYILADTDNSEISSYQYPRHVNAYYMKKAEDTGNLQNVYLHIDAGKLFDNIGISTDIDNSPTADVKECIFLLDGDVKSFPFEGNTSILGENEQFGEYSAEVVCYFYKSFCEYYTYVLATDDKKSALKMMKELYYKYNNGSGAVFDDTYIVYDVAELGGTLYMSYGKNNVGKECFFFSVYDIIDIQKEEEEKPGDVLVCDFKDKTFSTYGYQSNVESESIIHSVDIERTEYSIKCTVTGEKTSDVKGDDHTSSVKYVFRLIDESGNVVKTTNLYSPDIKTGEKFMTNVSFSVNNYDIKENFKIEIEEDVK